VRHEHDEYPTPAAAVRSLLDAARYLPTGMRWLDPCAGDGGLIRAALDVCPTLAWEAVEIQECHRQSLEATVGPGSVTIGDWLTMESPHRLLGAIVTNPPYAQALEFVQHAIAWQPAVVAMLLRLSFLGSQGRASFFSEWMPDVYVLSRRPSFTADGKTDGTEYAWMVWYPPLGPRSTGTVCVLPP
jgi:hypothetical protein